MPSAKKPAAKAAVGKQPAAKAKTVPAKESNAPVKVQGYRPGKRNICCRACFLSDGYDGGEKTCHFCGAEMFEIDII